MNIPHGKYDDDEFKNVQTAIHILYFVALFITHCVIGNFFHSILNNKLSN